jgi:hypothetical protein
MSGKSAKCRRCEAGYYPARSETRSSLVAACPDAVCSWIVNNFVEQLWIAEVRALMNVVRQARPKVGLTTLDGQDAEHVSD